MVKRAQTSLEMLVVLAALFAFFAAFLPVIRGGIEAAEFSVAARANAAALNDLAGMAREAFVLGRGNSFSRRVWLAGNGTLGFNATSSSLALAFSEAGRSKTILVPLDFELDLEGLNFSRGSHVVFVNNSGGPVEARLSRLG